MIVRGGIEPGSFRVSLTHLPRRPGNMWEADLEFVAPPELEVGMAKVAPASKMPAQIRIESVLDGVLVNLDFDFEVEAECARCLEPVMWTDHSRVTELFLYEETDSRGRVVQACDDASEELTFFYVQDDAVDLLDSVRDAIVLDLPLSPLCRPDCLGICPQCGDKLEGVPHDHATTDHRWSALEGLLESTNNDPLK
ncbi:MAG: YceD family protein [Candidatus Nanopelagicales bacterium]|jgi:uncharacterized protein|nr:DUF177 domain-containing protein [Actinomycetota bacterium]MBT5806362.1 DUF177 domain-containing protein [Actinomycetota bacterium]